MTIPNSEGGGGRLLRLEVENFKSYNGKQIIGPFDENFVSIIGPNGAGKSNLMDALSFVLGIQSNHLRSSHLVDLIYRRSTDGPRASHASVSAYYKRADGQELVFSRRISGSGASEYRVNNKTTPYTEYVRIWEGENVLIKARNFLVFQGDVEAIASKSPKDLTKLFEQVSGSDEFREDYEKCRVALERAVEESSMNFTKKRGLGAELKLVQEQREDVINFEKAQEDRDALQTEYYLWKLFHVEETARGIAKSVDEKASSVEETEKAVQIAETAWKESKKQHAKIQKDLLGVEKKVKVAQKKVSEGAPDEMRLQEKMKFIKQRITVAEETCTNSRKEMSTLQKDLTVAERESIELQQRGEEFERISEQKLSALEVSSELLGEYNSLKSNVAERVAKERLKVESLERRMAPEVAVKKQLSDKIAELQSAKSRVSDEIDSLESKQSSLRNQFDSNGEQMEGVQREIAGLIANKCKLQQQEVELTERLREVMNKLLQAKVDKQESDKEIKMRSTLETLKRIFPGVHGRMIDLCRPVNRKYEQAITVALGRNIDAVVVDHEKTAIACIQYLKEQRAGQATFIPLDTIQTSNGSGMLERAKGVANTRPILEVVKYEDIYVKAFQYACGTAVVCDTLSVAKHVYYERDIRVKAITIDGTVIHKSGLMTGGVNTSGNGNRRFEDKEIHLLKEERDQCVSTLSDITKQLKRSETEGRLNAQLVELQSRHGYLQEELEAQQRRLVGLQDEFMHLEQEESRSLGQLTQVEKSLLKSEKELTGWRSSIHTVEDQVFSVFCQKIGFENIRDFEHNRLSLAESINESRLQFTTLGAKLQHQMAFLSQQISESQLRLKEVVKTVQDLHREEAALESEQQSHLQRVHSKVESVSQAQGEFDRVKKQLLVEEEKVNEMRKLLSMAQEALTSASREVAAQECEIDKLLSARKVLLRTCRMEEIDLPLQDKDALFLELEDEESSKVLFDFSSLPRQVKNSSDMATERKYLDRIKHLQEELEKLAPNLRALDKLDGAESRLRESMEHFERTKMELKKAKDDFNSVKSKRSERFNAAFKPISSRIDAIYKELTRSEVVPTGGTAFLSVENGEEPYLEGVRFHAMPPMKRFLDMEQLSGGEKTVAALALLFAVHSYRPAPFFILDEIDAALDSANVQRVGAFIHGRAAGIPLKESSTKSSHSILSDDLSQSSDQSPRANGTAVAIPVQFLVISLKSSLYARAGALVGIYRDPEECSSRVLTLRLSDYPE